MQVKSYKITQTIAVFHQFRSSQTAHSDAVDRDFPAGLPGRTLQINLPALVDSPVQEPGASRDQRNSANAQSAPTPPRGDRHAAGDDQNKTEQDRESR